MLAAVLAPDPARCCRMAAPARCGSSNTAPATAPTPPPTPCPSVCRPPGNSGCPTSSAATAPLPESSQREYRHVPVTSPEQTIVRPGPPPCPTPNSANASTRCAPRSHPVGPAARPRRRRLRARPAPDPAGAPGVGPNAESATTPVPTPGTDHGPPMGTSTVCRPVSVNMRPRQRTHLSDRPGHGRIQNRDRMERLREPTAPGSGFDRDSDRRADLNRGRLAHARLHPAFLPQADLPAPSRPPSLTNAKPPGQSHAPRHPPPHRPHRPQDLKPSRKSPSHGHPRRAAEARPARQADARRTSRLPRARPSAGHGRRSPTEQPSSTRQPTPQATAARRPAPHRQARDTCRLGRGRFGSVLPGR